MRPRNEQQLAGLCHLFNAVPGWGMLFCGYVRYAMREESRLVVHHARQAMVFHSLILAGLMLWVLIELLCRVLAILSIYFSALLSSLNDLMVAGLIAVYVTTCLYGAWRCMSGRTFQYPLVRR